MKVLTHIYADGKITKFLARSVTTIDVFSLPVKLHFCDVADFAFIHLNYADQ